MEFSTYTRVDGRLMKLTHLNKVLYPAAGFKKRDLIAYYRQMSAVILPHLKNRMFTLKPVGKLTRALSEENNASWQLKVRKSKPGYLF